MALICVASAKGSPGATTAALTMCAMWGGPVVLAELDFTGTDLLYRLPASNPDQDADGVLGYLDEASRTGTAALLRHTTRVASGQDVLMGPAPSHSSHLIGRWTDLAGALAAEDRIDVIADVGRLQPEFPANALLAVADALVLVTRPLVDGVAHVLARAAEAVDTLPPQSRCYVVVVSDSRDTQSLKEIATLMERAAIPAHVLGRLADDAAGVALLSSPWSARLQGTLLMRSARALATSLQNRLLVPPEPESTSA